MVLKSERTINHFYPRPPRGGRPGSGVLVHLIQKISIHALREEGDKITLCHLVFALGISIHALREEGDKAPP